MPDLDPITLADITADLVSAYVAKNHVRAAELPALISAVHASLAGLCAPEPAAAEPDKPTPPVSIRKSVMDDYLVSMEDGKRYKTLKRHLSTRGMTPDDYRAKWGLPSDYPMVCKNYAAERSSLAKSIGLGAMRRKR